jgi:hypothetical protein
VTNITGLVTLEGTSDPTFNVRTRAQGLANIADERETPRCKPQDIFEGPLAGRSFAPSERNVLETHPFANSDPSAFVGKDWPCSTLVVVRATISGPRYEFQARRFRIAGTRYDMCAAQYRYDRGRIR